MRKKYTIKQFRKEFSTDDICLEYVFKKKYPEVYKDYYKIKGRKAYANKQGDHIHPLGGTIFHKSSTSLVDWFYAIYLFSQSKNGVSAKELERQLGVTYKTAWRMAKQIRSLMKQPDNLLTGTVEVDETYFGGKHAQEDGFSKKETIMGMVERGGNIKASVIPSRGIYHVLDEIYNNVSPDSVIMSDEYSAYKKLSKLGYTSKRVKHGKRHWVHGDIHTNTIEGFWGQLKRSISGTYHFVSRKHLQDYVNEFAWRYSHRHENVFEALISRV